jgi:hypothetical protein
MRKRGALLIEKINLNLQFRKENTKITVVKSEAYSV